MTVQSEALATKEDISKLELKISENNIKIAEVRADLIKWMFLFWIGQLASIIAIVKFFFH